MEKMKNRASVDLALF